MTVITVHVDDRPDIEAIDAAIGYPVRVALDPDGEGWIVQTFAGLDPKDIARLHTLLGRVKDNIAKDTPPVQRRANPPIKQKANP